MKKELKTSELREMNDVALKKQLDDLQESWYKFRFQQASGQLPDTNKITQVRRDIARVKTIIRERERAAQRGKAGA